MISPEEAAAVAMTVEAAIPDPAAMALSVKSLTIDLPLAIALEAVRFHVRVATAWFDLVDTISALNRPAVEEPGRREDEPPVRVEPQSPYAVAATLAA